MITDLNRADSDPFKHKIYDVCICGAGVAGITLASKLSEKLNVVLLEGGGRVFSLDSQEIYKGENFGEEYYNLMEPRLRYLGGSSNHWGGWCHPLDHHDFVPRSYQKYSGWPIRRSDLDPYLEEANGILGIDHNSGEGQTPGVDLVGQVAASNDFLRAGFTWSWPPTRFGAEFSEILENKTGLDCYLNSNLVDMELVDSLERLHQVEVRNYAEKAFKVRAKVFVLACGGIENPRILLNCNRQIPSGIGNSRDLVGRFFTEHPNKIVGRYILEDKVKEQVLRHWHQGGHPHKNSRFFAPTTELMEREKIMNFGIFLEPLTPPDTKLSFKSVLKNALCDSEWGQRGIEFLSGKPLEPLTCTPLMSDRVRIVSEQVLDPSNRVTLSNETDRFGMRRSALHWNLADIDKRTIQIACIRLGQVFAQLGVGRINLDSWVLSDAMDVPGRPNLIGGRHHMCTTRMSESDLNGVVNSDSRVFDVDNLYVAGSSVFSTVGNDSPTISIVQLTLRLADHLNESLLDKK
jgi:hypothetical protein